MRNYTPEQVTSLKENEVFVFGSNAAGFHSKGAALLAKDKFGAIYGEPRGLQGRSYAIVTKKDWRVEKSSTLEEIYNEVKNLAAFAQYNPHLTFLVTKIGSALAGYTIAEMRSVFYDARGYLPDNVILPIEYEVRDEEVT